MRRKIWKKDAETNLRKKERKMDRWKDGQKALSTVER